MPLVHFQRIVEYVTLKQVWWIVVVQLSSIIYLFILFVTHLYISKWRYLCGFVCMCKHTVYPSSWAPNQGLLFHKSILTIWSLNPNGVCFSIFVKKPRLWVLANTWYWSHTDILLVTNNTRCEVLVWIISQKTVHVLYWHARFMMSQPA